MSGSFDPYYKWLGIPPDEQPPHHYRLLAVRLFEPDADVIEAGAEQRMAHVRKYQTGPYSSLSQRILNELASARLCLLNAEQRQLYDRTLRSTLAGAVPPALPVPPAVPPGRAAAVASGTTPIAVPVAPPSHNATMAASLEFINERPTRRLLPQRRRERDRSSAALLMGVSAMILALVALVFFVRVMRSQKHVRIPVETVDVAETEAPSATTADREAEELPAFPEVTPHPVTLPDPQPNAGDAFRNWLQKFSKPAGRAEPLDVKAPAASAPPTGTPPAGTPPSKPASSPAKPVSPSESEPAAEAKEPAQPARGRRTLADWVTASIERRTLERGLAGGGGDGGVDFVETPSAGALLTGFNVTLSPTQDITSIQPVFVGVRGTRGGPGGRYGTARGRQVAVVARHGYAVAAVRVQGERAVDGFEVEFARITSTGLDQENSYRSPWIGRRSSDPGLTLGGDGLPAVGIHGRAGAVVYSLGLIQLPAE